MAPECCKHLEIDTVITPPFTQAADIWSLGCLLSNLIILSVLGETGRNDYRKQRIKENEGISGGSKKSGYEKGFHKSQSERLESVHEKHKEAVEKCPGKENQRTLCTVSEFVLEHLLQPDPSHRLEARAVLSAWNAAAQRLTGATISKQSVVQKTPVHPAIPREADDEPTQPSPLQPGPLQSPQERSPKPVAPKLNTGPQPGPREPPKVTVGTFVTWHNSKSKTKLDKQFPELHQELNSLGPFKPRAQRPLKFLNKPVHYPGRNHVS